VRRIIEPTQFGYSTDEFNKGGGDKILQAGSLVSEVGKDVVADIDPLRDGEVVPVCGDEVCEGVGGHKACIV